MGKLFLDLIEYKSVKVQLLACSTQHSIGIWFLVCSFVSDYPYSGPLQLCTILEEEEVTGRKVVLFSRLGTVHLLCHTGKGWVEVSQMLTLWDRGG